MRHLTVRIFIAILTFIIGVATASLWFIHRSSVNNPISDISAAPATSPNNVTQKDASQPEFVGNVPIGRLVANPKEFDGKRVQVIGFVHLEFEGNGIYANQEDYKYSLYWNGLWLSIPKTDVSQYMKYNDSYVTVEGIFNANHKGHLGFWSGSIENITMFKRWAKVKRQH
jgi:hypothetical protein